MPFDVTRWVDPFCFQRDLWPEVRFYREQRNLIRSVQLNDQTFCRAGNMLGKDFVAGFLCVWFFCTRYPCRVVTTSVKDDHLRVLWGEIGRFIETSKVPLDIRKGGPLILRHRDVRRMWNGAECDISYLLGQVSKKGEGMAGHHAAYTLAVIDEASGVDDLVFTQMSTWAGRFLVFGNPNPCSNFFRVAFKGKPGTPEKGGDVQDPHRPWRFNRKCFRIKAEDSPNVRLALEEKRAGRTPSNKTLVPGVIKYDDGAKGYEYRRRRWDPIQQCVGLDAEFWEGGDVMMFPAEWLNYAEQWHLSRPAPLRERWMGVDSGWGVANTSWCVIDRLGVLHLESLKTPNTREIPRRTKALMKEWGVPPENVMFDLGGGGKEHADNLRDDGYEGIQTVGFGETVTPPIRLGQTQFEVRVDEREDKYAYKNRRAQMYWALRSLLDTSGEDFEGFAIPAKFSAIRDQLSPIPVTYDNEGRRTLLPKNKKEGVVEGTGRGPKTLTEIIGHSPDEADALAVAVFCMTQEQFAPTAGAY